MRPEGRELPRPVAVAGCLWLAIAGLFGAATIFLLAAAPIVALFYAVPLGLLAAFGFGLITRRSGVGFPLLSLILGTALSVMGLLEAIRQDPAATTGNLVVALRRRDRAEFRHLRVGGPDGPASLREGLGRRAVLALIVVGVYVGILTLAVNVGPLRGCVPIAPRELPSGAAPGQGIEGVSGGAKQVVWGSGSDRVEQIVGLTYWDTLGLEDSPTLVRSTMIHEHPAMLYRMSPLASDWDLGFSWAEDGCARTVFLAPGTTSEQAEDFASRY